MPHGKGVAYFGDGSYYIGIFYKGMVHGNGRLIKNKLVYDGNFHNEMF